MDTLPKPGGLSVSLMDAAVQKCPYPSFDRLRQEQPIYLDPQTGFYIVTAYDDVRRILADPELFSSAEYINKVRALKPEDRHRRVMAVYEEKGWVPGGSVSWLDDPEHQAVRGLFDKAFRASKIVELDPFLQKTAEDIVSAFAQRGEFDPVREFGVPLPLTVIMHQMGAGGADMWKIKEWLDAWMIRMGLMQTEEEEIAAVLQEIEAQHYFKPIIDRMRAQPDGSVLSDLINTRMPNGRTLSDNDILGLIMSDTFVAGSETTANALATGVLLLCRHQDVYARLQADPERYLKTFVEEVIRLEAPVQMAARIARRDVEIKGVQIPAGAVFDLRFGAANRDASAFECPEKLDLDRAKAGSHMSFGSGIHHCLGAPLARRELYWGFKTLLESVKNMRLAPTQAEPDYLPHFMARVVEPFEVQFDVKDAA